MSAYLNLGMVSPFTVTRDVIRAVKRNPAGGASKFLMSWGSGGISYSWCFHNPRHRVSAKEALPAACPHTL